MARKTNWVIWGAVFFLGILPMSAPAVEGFYLGAGLGLSVPAMSGDLMDDLNPGAGDAIEFLNLGYGFTKNFSVGLAYGAAAGGASDDFGDNATWGEGYLGLNARWNFDEGRDFVPYVELGLGSYLFMVLSDDLELTTDAMAPGLKLGVGGHWYFGSKKCWYLEPEISYHYVDYSTDATIEFADDDFDDVEIDFDENASMVLVLVRVGYHWKK